ncbi:hypothetical protein BASA81_001316 [Batrachochytrium salamandrivorans]|nr:hypothetical protein BASA81_001316 [Batrachochytrium salamandrivorans]
MESEAKRVRLEGGEEGEPAAIATVVAATSTPSLSAESSALEAADPIAKIQDSFVALGEVYVSALRQCFQGALGPEEADADGKAIDKAISHVLEMVNLLPNNGELEQQHFDLLVSQDEALNLELAQLKAEADEALKRIKALRVEVAARVM